jgi:hypothetical protein
MKRLILIMVLMVLGSSGCGGGSRRSVFNLFGREDAPIDMSDLTTVEKTKLIERIHSMELKAKRAAASNKVALFFILAGVAGGFAWWRGSNLGFGVVLLSAVGWLWTRADQELVMNRWILIGAGGLFVAGILVFGWRNFAGKRWAWQIANNENPTRATAGVDKKYKGRRSWREVLGV